MQWGFYLRWLLYLLTVKSKNLVVGIFLGNTEVVYSVALYVMPGTPPLREKGTHFVLKLRGNTNVQLNW